MILEASGIVKQYGATRALKGVDFTLHAGAVNVLIGENGAGKSTLMKIIAGIEKADEGTITLSGHPVKFESIADAVEAGVTIVHQELNLCQNLSVSDNIFLGRNITRSGIIDRQAEAVRTEELLKQFKQNFTPDTLVSELRVGQQQIVEIAKALLYDAKVLILDEPTSALSPNEVTLLFELIADLRQKGVAIVYISHRLEELMTIGDYITVLRDGNLIATSPAGKVNIDWIIARMLGEEKSFERKFTSQPHDEERLKLQAVSLKHKNGNTLLYDVNASFAKGEVTAIYGLLGCGRTELFESLAGLRADAKGEILLNSQDLNGLSVVQRTKRGVFMVSEDRKLEGILPNLTVGDNLGISFLSGFTRWSVIKKHLELQSLLDMTKRMWVKSDGLKASITSLSGGNQQKVMLGRCMLPGPEVLLIDEPSRGVDIGARGEIFDRIRSLAATGTTVIYATSDLHEALQFSDRILVMASGRITGEYVADDATEADLVYACNKTAASQAATEQ